MAWFLRKFECPCGETWEDEHSCACNDHCPSCDAEIEPSDDEDLSIIVEKGGGCWLVLVSPPTAENDPAYQQHEFPTEPEALEAKERFEDEAE